MLLVTSTPSFGNAAFSNTIQPSMQNQYIDHNHFTQQADNIIPQNVRNNNELYFPKAQGVPPCCMLVPVTFVLNCGSGTEDTGHVCGLGCLILG
jgi:hypothetical protein